MIKLSTIKKISLVILLILVLIMTAGILVRNKVLNHMIETRVSALEKRTGITITYSRAKFSGISNIKIMEIVVHPPKGEQLLAIDRVEVRFSPFALFAFKLKTTSAEIINPKLTLWREGNESNYLFLLESRKTDSTITASDTARINYKAGVDLIFSQIFRHIPETIHISNLKAEANINRHHVALAMDELNADARGFASYAMIIEDSIENNRHSTIIIDESIEFFFEYGLIGYQRALKQSSEFNDSILKPILEFEEVLPELDDLSIDETNFTNEDST